MALVIIILKINHTPFVMIADVAEGTLNSSAANLSTAVNGVASGTLSTRKGSLGSDVRMILNVTFVLNQGDGGIGGGGRGGFTTLNTTTLHGRGRRDWRRRGAHCTFGITHGQHTLLNRSYVVPRAEAFGAGAALLGLLLLLLAPLCCCCCVRSRYARCPFCRVFLRAFN